MNKRLNFIASLLLLMCSTIGFSQQVPFYNHYIINPFVYNPSFAGADGSTNAYVTRGQRYMGYGSGAINNTLSIEGKFFIPNSGFGLVVGQQSVGIQKQLSAQLSYAYHLKIKENHHLSFGVSGGYLDNRIDLSSIDVSQPQDPYLAGMRSYRPTYDFNLGIRYNWDKLTIGVSVPQLIGNKVKFSKQDTRGYYSLARHFMGSAQYELKFSAAEKLTVTPQGLVRFTPGAPIQYDITAHLDFENIGWFSATYKSDYAVQFNLGFHIMKQLHVGYSYEFVTGSFKNNYTGVNHEFLLGYTFESGKTKKIVKRVEVTDPKLQRENEDLKRQLEEKQKELDAQESLRERLKDSLATQKQKVTEAQEKEPELEEKPKETEEDNKDFRDASSHNFIETDGSRSPSGYYVVIGVFSMDQYVDKNIGRSKTLFPDSYYVTNLKNTYDYVVIRYTKSREEAQKALNKYRDNTGKDVWILDYQKK